ncbi:hypothetical protein [Desulfoferrobacter suflitae]|uniref:hypothetical protein n=1 Tax=Desulfoferrobacter suflitae TaxID=2865782 RepID=UPI00216454EF|nr:hypothetical protein [Desulfoferrobacter suflitae]MCK8601499.1 hypothetical protein [Desulfoferrobacter suflitae]
MISPEDSAESDEIVLYMLHCGLDGRILQKVCRQYDLNIRIHQFPREELFSYHMHTRRKTPDLILIRGHFIPLVHELDHNRDIPYVVVSSKLKYGNGQPVFIHADKGYKDSQDTLAIYHSLARTIKKMVEARLGGHQTERDEGTPGGPQG